MGYQWTSFPYTKLMTEGWMSDKRPQPRSEVPHSGPLKSLPCLNLCNLKYFSLSLDLIFLYEARLPMGYKVCGFKGC